MNKCCINIYEKMNRNYKNMTTFLKTKSKIKVNTEQVKKYQQKL